VYQSQNTINIESFLRFCLGERQIFVSLQKVMDITVTTNTIFLQSL